MKKKVNIVTFSVGGKIRWLEKDVMCFSISFYVKTMLIANL